MILTKRPLDRTRPLFKAMEESGVEFYLTGSRYFKYQVPEGTDWDFFVEYHEGLCVELRRLGFVQLDRRSTYGMNCKSVWESSNIHIQVVDDAVKKRKLQQLLCGYSFLLEDKYKAKLIWNLLYAAYDAGHH